jgi:hypothetical protein
MALPSIVGAFWFENGIDFKREKSSFHPIGTIRFCVKRPNDKIRGIVARNWPHLLSKLPPKDAEWGGPSRLYAEAV